jgi:hypothetical protein
VLVRARRNLLAWAGIVSCEKVAGQQGINLITNPNPAYNHSSHDNIVKLK